MSRRLASITLDNVDDLPQPCRTCVFWEAGHRAPPGATKDDWLSSVLLDWGSCGRILYVDGEVAGYALYAPPEYVGGVPGYATSEVSSDAILLMTARVLPQFHRRGPRPGADPVGRQGRAVASRRSSARGLRRPPRRGARLRHPVGVPDRRGLQDGPPTPPLSASAPGSAHGLVLARRCRAGSRAVDRRHPARQVAGSGRREATDDRDPGGLSAEPDRGTDGLRRR